MNPFSIFPSLSDLEESVKQFFECDEKIKNLQSQLIEIETEMFFCKQIAKAFQIPDSSNPFDVN